MATRVLNHILAKRPSYGSRHKTRPSRGAFVWWRWGESNPRPRHAGWRLFHRLGPLLEPPGGERTSRLGRAPPSISAFPGGHPGRPSQCLRPAGRSHPSGGFTSPLPGDRGCSLGHLSKLRRRGPVRSYRWQFCLGGLMRGPADQPPPAPDTRITTCRNRSPPLRDAAPRSPREGAVEADIEYAGPVPVAQAAEATAPPGAGGSRFRRRCPSCRCRLHR